MQLDWTPARPHEDTPPGTRWRLHVCTRPLPRWVWSADAQGRATCPSRGEVPTQTIPLSPLSGGGDPSAHNAPSPGYMHHVPSDLPQWMWHHAQVPVGTPHGRVSIGPDKVQLPWVHRGDASKRRASAQQREHTETPRPAGISCEEGDQGPSRARKEQPSNQAPPTTDGVGPHTTDTTGATHERPGGTSH